MFSVRIKPLAEESLISYLTRLASENGTKMLSVWRGHSRDRKINPQRLDSPLLELIPERVINVGDLAVSTEVSEKQLFAMTFHQVLEKFCPTGEMSHSRILKGMIRDELCYCPHCLKDKAYITLLQGITGVDYCFKHQVSLLNNCGQCGKKIRVNDIEHIGVCPYCYSDLKEGQFGSKARFEGELNEQRLLQKIWKQLIVHNGQRLHPSEVATRMIYLLNNEEPFFNKYTVQVNADTVNLNLPYLLQIAQGSLQKKRTVHISTLINVLIHRNIDYLYFEGLFVPKDFRTSIQPLVQGDMYKTACCLAPWCSFFQKRGSLVPTGTSSKRYNDGRTLRKHVACTTCGSRYAFDSVGHLVRKDHFLIGYDYLINKCNDKNKISDNECRRPSGLNRDQWWAVIAYFSSRDFFYDTEGIQDNLLRSVIEYIRENGNMNNIHKWECWKTYRHFLMYRYHIQVMNALVRSNRNAPRRHDINDFQARATSICKSLLENDQDISIDRISFELNITSSTIRAWGLQHQIIEMRKQQIEKRSEAKRKQLYEKVDLYFEKNKTRRALSKDIYNFIGVSQSYVHAIAPDICAYIRELKFNNNHS